VITIGSNTKAFSPKESIDLLVDKVFTPVFNRLPQILTISAAYLVSHPDYSFITRPSPENLFLNIYSLAALTYLSSRKFFVNPDGEQQESQNTALNEREEPCATDSACYAKPGASQTVRG